MRIIDPDGLFKRNGKGRGYDKLKRTYYRSGFLSTIKGRKVKCWKLVYGADNEDGNKFIPVFYKNKKE